MHTVDTLLHARWIIPGEPDRVLSDHSLAIHEGRIVALIPAGQARAQYRGTTELTLDRHALVPGLVNAHTHAAMPLLRGLSDDLHLARARLSGYRMSGPTTWEGPWTASGTNDTVMTISGITVSGAGIIVAAHVIHNFDIPPHIMTQPADSVTLIAARSPGVSDDWHSHIYRLVDGAGTYSLTWTASNTYSDWAWNAIAVFIPGVEL